MKDPNWIIVATAHPAKFENVVEPILKQKIQIPELNTPKFKAGEAFKDAVKLRNN